MRVERDQQVLPDVLDRGLGIVFVGTAAGDRSAARRAYYAGPGNRFWATLGEIGLTPRRFEPSEFPLLLEHGIGLTDIAKFTHGTDSRLRGDDYDICGFLDKVRLFSPRFVAFNGKLAASKCYGCSTGVLSYGRQPGTLESAAAYVLPSTSGAAGGYWDVSYWCELASADEAR